MGTTLCHWAWTLWCFLFVVIDVVVVLVVFAGCFCEFWYGLYFWKFVESA
jgi:hypothetical protein